MEDGGKARLQPHEKDDKREKGGVEEVMCDEVYKTVDGVQI